MYKLTVDMTPYTPVNTIRTLKMERTPESSARLSSVLDQLSLLSHELSLNLGNGETKPRRGKDDLFTPVNSSLRRRAFRNREFNNKPSRNGED